MKILLQMTANNCFTTVVIESVTNTQDGYTYFYWRKVNECRTKFVGRYATDLVQPNTSTFNSCKQVIIDETCRLADGTFAGIMDN